MEVRWITAFIDRHPDGFDPAIEFWQSVSGSHVSPWRGDNAEFATLLPADGADAHLRVQRTQSGEPGSHIDLHVADVRTSADQGVAGGATVIADYGSYVTLASPSGVVFCIVPHHGERLRQQPVALVPGGPTTLVDQVTIDIDPECFAEEIRFWSSVTGWSPQPARGSEFAPLERPLNMPLRVMVQRRGGSSGPSGCHLDLACDDVPIAMGQHEDLGATCIAVHPFWTVMADPAGVPYCLTRRGPGTGLLPPVTSTACS